MTSAARTFPSFLEIALPRGALQLKSFCGWQAIFQRILPSLLLVLSHISLPADIKRCANPATWGEEYKKHACQCDSAPDKDIRIIRFYWIPQQQLRCKPQFLLIVTLGLLLLSSIFSPLNLLPNKGQACSAMEKSCLASPCWEASEDNSLGREWYNGHVLSIWSDSFKAHNKQNITHWFCSKWPVSIRNWVFLSFVIFIFPLLLLPYLCIFTVISWP